MKNKFRNPRGQIGILFAFASAAMLGGIALCTDVSVMYLNWHHMQKAVDAAALAGVAYLPEDQVDAISTANNYGQTNGLAASEIGTPIPSIDTTTGLSTLTVSASRNVPYYFARVLGLTTQLVKVSATAEAAAPTSNVQCSSSSSFGTSVGACGLVPIGLDNATPYTYQAPITLNQGPGANGQWGPGNWGSLALGGNGGNVLRSDIANGYMGPVSIGNVSTEPGKAVGPIDQGFTDRINAGLSQDPSGTFANHTPNDPRVVLVPLVDLSTAQGKSSVMVTGFAMLWINRAAGGTIQANFISGVAPGGIADPQISSTGPTAPPRLIE
jgi:Flp pilus assembly protein TadG